MFVIAGVTGHVGSVVAQELLSRGQKVKVIVRDAAKGSPWSQKGAELAVGALGDQAFLTSTLRGTDGFFTLLPPDYAATDIFASQKKLADTIAAAVKESGVPHVVMLSSIGADLATGTGPVKGLHYLEEALRATGTKLTALRAGMFQENVHNAVGPARDAGIYPNFTPSEDAVTAMIATRDIGHLAADSLTSPAPRSQVIDIHGPTYSVRQVADKLGAALGKTLQVVNIPQPGWVGAMTQGGVPKPLAEALAELYAAFGTGNIRPLGDRLVQGKTPIDETINNISK